MTILVNDWLSFNFLPPLRRCLISPWVGLRCGCCISFHSHLLHYAVFDAARIDCVKAQSPVIMLAPDPRFTGGVIKPTLVSFCPSLSFSLLLLSIHILATACQQGLRVWVCVCEVIRRVEGEKFSISVAFLSFSYSLPHGSGGFNGPVCSLVQINI